MDIKWPKYRSTIDVNNQLATISNAIEKLRPNPIKDATPFDFKKYGNDIYVADNCVPIELAERVRDFLQDIYCDPRTKPLNDEDNQPKCNVFDDVNDMTQLKLAFENPISDSKLWTYENYCTYPLNSIWRILPLTLNAFIGSPIIELINTIEAKWLATKFANWNTLYKSCWVLQMIPQNYGIGRHSDACAGRKISFIYYLTSDDWYQDVDGGGLAAHVGRDCVKLNPTFNRLVAWEMFNSHGPDHYVNTVYTSKKRLALVGFFNEIN